MTSQIQTVAINPIHATTRVTFGAGSAPRREIQIELDARPDGFNGGKTTFAPGDTAYFLVWHDPRITILAVMASVGILQEGMPSTGSRNFVAAKEQIQFANCASARLKYPALAIESVTWLGASMGGLWVQPDDEGKTVRASMAGTATAMVDYWMQTPRVFGLISPQQVGYGAITNFASLIVVEAFAP